MDRTINNLRYANDITLIAEIKEDLEELIRNVKKTSKDAGLLLNFNKTKVMTMAEINNFEVDIESIEVVKEFNFLGCILSGTRKCEEELKEKLRKWNECLKDKGLKINEDKTKVMCESFGTDTTQVVGNVKHPCSVCLKGVGVNSIRCIQCI